MLQKGTLRLKSRRSEGVRRPFAEQSGRPAESPCRQGHRKWQLCQQPSVTSLPSGAFLPKSPLTLEIRSRRPAPRGFRNKEIDLALERGDVWKTYGVRRTPRQPWCSSFLPCCLHGRASPVSITGRSPAEKRLWISECLLHT
ncbi:unnamed protein product [Rangifer tarandus platyrhynchus]|uniref:Uncharacterized protein n=1 Tax=Rangifer tarandus platyrhynchus TaxID=3082113 RepID=A0ABN8XNA1_RANTA|nr:unnamed protein product [Rangifer tarandus platyrhynchus]